MRIQVDLHVHTIASGHAFSTVGEIAREASLRRLRGVGIADHGPAMPGGPHLYHFSCLRFLPRLMEGVRILRSAELNIVNGRGDLDLPDGLLGSLDYAMVGFHRDCGYKSGPARKNTAALIGAMQKRRVRVVTHPGNPSFPIDVPEVVRAARDLGVALEVNNASFGSTRVGSLETCSQIAAAAAASGAPICLSSDAHVACQVGEVADAWQVASQAGVREDQVVNRTLTGCLRFLGLEAEAVT